LVPGAAEPPYEPVKARWTRLLRQMRLLSLLEKLLLMVTPPLAVRLRRVVVTAAHGDNIALGLRWSNERLSNPNPSFDRKARDTLRRVLVRDQADRDAISSQLFRYRDGHGDDWADIIDVVPDPLLCAHRAPTDSRSTSDRLRDRVHGIPDTLRARVLVDGLGDRRARVAGELRDVSET
jgi:hypothetical protein